jgi:hypothetical protein
MPQDFVIRYVDDYDRTTMKEMPGAPGQVAYLPPGWIAVNWTDYGNPQAPVNMGPLYFSSQANADAAQQLGMYP